MTTPTHITTSGGLISAAFIENVREPGSRQRGVESASFALGSATLTTRPWAEAPKSPAALEETIATAWELLLERWDAIRNDLPMMDVSQVRSRWPLPLFQLLDFDPVYLRGDTVLDEVGPETWGRWFADAPVHTSPPPEGQPATPAPFVWDEERRAILRAELDSLYAHLYGLTRDELVYILDAFPIVRRKDEG